MTSSTLFATVRRDAFGALCLAAAAVITGCSTPEAQLRATVAGTYITDITRTAGGSRLRQYETLNLTPGGRWAKNGWVEFGARRQEYPTDSGTYRLDGVNLDLYSVVEPGMPFRYTIAGDTLFTANAGFLYAMTGHDIGEQFLVRER